MTALTFPSNPILGQLYDAPNGVQYVFDGIKWMVDSMTSTAAAITNSIQDRVAPMIVNGNNSGITATYDSTDNRLNLTINIDGGDASSNY